MTGFELNSLLDRLIGEWENEVVEFKRGGAGFSTGEIGEYFSALSNEANLRGMRCGWLVFGVHNKTRRIVGTDYDVTPEEVNRSGGLKFQITQRTDPGMCFSGIYTLKRPEGRVVLFEIPAAPRGIPIAWNGHYYARSGESLVALGLDKMDAIRREGVKDDWTAQIVEDATVGDLDETALALARERYAEKHAKTVTREEVEAWPMSVFLDKARLSRDGKITRAAMLLVGKDTACHKLTPYMAQLVWKLVGEERANEIFYPPYLLSTSELYSRIRNVQVRMIIMGTLQQIEVPKYSRRMVLEALHNCIAHQDYGLHSRIVVTEYVDRVTLENRGCFYCGKPEDYITGERTPSDYRNPQLVAAMSELNMIDTMGYGIHRMYSEQKARFMPMHDYTLTGDSVKMTIYGHFVDEAYSSLLVKRPGMSIEDVCLLDRVQKGLKIPAAAVAHLRSEGLIEGRVPHLHVSAKVAEMTGRKAEYMKKRAMRGGRYRQLLIDYLGKFDGVTRKEINEYLLDEIHGDLTREQKLEKISNLLTYMRRKGDVFNSGSDAYPLWKLSDKVRKG